MAEAGPKVGKKKQVQIIICGNHDVGKTSIIKRYADKEFDEEHITTLGLDFVTKKYTYEGIDATIKIWDTAGQERFKTLTYSFYKKANGIIIAFDVTDQKTFDNIKNWIDSINEHADQGIPKILVGNKNDMIDDRKVQLESAKSTAAKYNLKYFDVSAKADNNIKECMEEIFN